MATELLSAKRSVGLFTSKPMVLFNAATIRPKTITLREIVFQVLEAVHRENVGVLLLATLQAPIKA